MVGSFRVWLLGSLLLSGCAYQQAMRQGDKLAAAGDWSAAYDAYSAAVEANPKKTDAVAARTKARDEAVADSLEDAEAFLELREYEKCAEKLSYIESIDSDRPEVFAIRTDLTAAMRTDFERQWEAGMQRKAYELTVLTRKLLPTVEGLDAQFTQCRKHFTDEAKALLKKGEHEDALVAIRTISDLEPDRKGDVTGLEHEILTAWADALTKKASSEAKAKRYGPASVLYARAYEIAGRRPDIDQSRQIAATLKEDGQFTVRLVVTGPSDRGASLKNMIEKGMVGVTDATLTDSSSADLTMKLVVGKQSCTESKETGDTSKEYVSGQVEKPNPLFGELTAKREQAKADEATAAQRAAELEPDVKAAEATLAEFDERVTMAEKTRDAATGKLDMADSQLRAAQELRDSLAGQLEGMRAGAGTAEAIAQWEDKLGEQGKRIAEWQGVILEHQDAQSAAQREIDALQVERGPAADALERLKSGYEAVVTDRNTAQQAYATLTTQLATTPKTIWEDVYATFKYTVEDWTRVCKAPASVSIQPRWDAGGDRSRTFSPEHKTEDRAHPGLEKAEVPDDPKQYPESDDALIGKGDEATGKELVTWLGTLADDHFKQRRMDTMIALQSDPVRSTTDLVALYVGAPGRLDEQTLTTFATHCKQHYGLEKLELLRGAGSTGSP